MAHPTTVFYVYAETDEMLRQELEKHLALLQRQEVLASWQESQAGALWEQEREQAFNEASLILLLVSADFLASDVCYQEQMVRALERQKQGEVQVLPILVRPVGVTNAPFTHLPMVPTNRQAVTLWSNQDAAWMHITEGIRCVLEEKPLPVVQEQKEAARYTAENQQAVYGQIIGERNEIHQHYYLPASPPLASTVAHVKPIWMVPYPRNPFFTGRRELLTQLAETLHTGHPAALSQPQAISGLGGIGKTQIAIEYAYQYAQDYQAVLWAQADTRENLTSSYIALAGVLNLPEKEAVESAQVVAAVRQWLQDTSGYLLILDNADDLKRAGSFLPPKLSGQVLLTTRAQVTGRFAHKLEVETLPTEQGTLFLLLRAGLLAVDAPLEQAKEAERVVAKRLCEELGGLPLALDQAGAYIEETGCSLVRYEQRYHLQRKKVLAERRGELVNDHPLPVAATWKLSFEQVEQRSQVAADLLRVCAFLAPDAIPETIFTQGAALLGPQLAEVERDADVFDEAVEVLRAYSLVRRERSGGATSMLSVHRLVQAVLKDQMGDQEQQQWGERIVRAVAAVLPPVKHETWERWEPMLPQAVCCSEIIEQEHLRFAEATLLLQQTGWYLTERVRYREAEVLLKQSLAMTEQGQGLEHFSMARDCVMLGHLYKTQGKYALAEPLLVRALAIREQKLGPGHPNTASSLNNLAELYRDQGKYEQAEPLYKRALAIREQKLGPTHPSTATSLNNLAELYRDQGKYEQAEPLYKRALAIDEQELGPGHPSTATSLNNLAGLYRAQGKYEQAEPLYTRALAIREQELGLGHPDTASSLNNLAALYQDQGKYEQAEPLFQRALEMREHSLGEEHPDTATSLFWLAVGAQRQQQYDKALAWYERAWGIYRRMLGVQHPTTRRLLGYYAELLRELGREEEAVALEAEGNEGV